MVEYMLFLLRVLYPNNTKHATVITKEERKDKRKEKKNVFRVSIFFFFEKEETNRETRAHFFHFTREHYTTLAPFLLCRTEETHT
jgi:hypothetical protein